MRENRYKESTAAVPLTPEEEAKWKKTIHKWFTKKREAPPTADDVHAAAKRVFFS
jgi:hypothetical protein